MAAEMPCMSYLALYVISMHIVNSNSRSSNHWKLNLSAGKVEQADASLREKSHQSHGNRTHTTNSSSSSSSAQASQQENKETHVALDAQPLAGDENQDSAQIVAPDEERLMNILTNKVVMDGEWIVTSPMLEDHEHFGGSKEELFNQLRPSENPSQLPSGSRPIECAGTSCSHHRSEKNEPGKKKPRLNCGKKVNSTIYDHLRGVSERNNHSNIPEPDVAMVFKSSSKTAEVDMKELENKLREAKVNVEKEGDSQRAQAAQVYNLIGNFWRIKGNTQTAIECFRKALHISPEEPTVLLNLARVLFNLQYLDDAIFLARRSLHLQPSGENSWLQHYSLGEILRSYGHHQEAASHFHQALELNPGFAPAVSQLRELSAEGLGVSSQPSVTHFTLFIILCLVVGVLVGIVTSIETGFQDSSASLSADGSGKLQPRHFNRAMAMRSIKLGINPRLCRLRKAAN